jgi:hypothetical protein
VLELVTGPSHVRSVFDVIFSLAIIPLALGGFLVVGSLIEWREDWCIGEQGVRITRRSAFRKRELELRRSDIAMSNVVQHTWESREATFSVEVSTRQGYTLRTPEFGARSEAEDVLQDIRNSVR